MQPAMERPTAWRRPLAVMARPMVMVLMANVVARGLGFLFSVLLAHGVDRSAFATAIFLISSGFFVSELVLTGYPMALSRFVAIDTDAREQGAWLVSAVAGGVPLFAVSTAIGAALAVAGDAPPALLVVVILGLSIDAYYFGLLRGLGRFGLLSSYRVAANLLQLVLLAAAIAAGIATLELAVVVYAFVYLGPIAAIELRYRILGGILALGVVPDRDRLARLTSFAVPALVSGTAYAAIVGFDVFFVRVFAPDALADYGAARTLALAVALVPSSVGVVLMPRVAAAAAADRPRLLYRAMWAVVAGTIAAGVAYALLGEWTIKLLFPPAYAGAAEGLRYLVPAIGLIGLFSILAHWWSGTGRPELPAACLSVGAAVTIVGHVALTSRLGVPGAGLAIGAGTATGLALLGIVTALRVASARPEG
jgi:O-antigen/teichoic acid export membrane protein